MAPPYPDESKSANRKLWIQTDPLLLRDYLDTKPSGQWLRREHLGTDIDQVSLPLLSDTKFTLGYLHEPSTSPRAGGNFANSIKPKEGRYRRKRLLNLTRSEPQRLKRKLGKRHLTLNLLTYRLQWLEHRTGCLSRV